MTTSSVPCTRHTALSPRIAMTYAHVGKSCLVIGCVLRRYIDEVGVVTTKGSVCTSSQQEKGRKDERKTETSKSESF